MGMMVVGPNHWISMVGLQERLLNRSERSSGYLIVIDEHIALEICVEAKYIFHVVRTTLAAYPKRNR
jgi:hypothetical protein